MLDIGFTELLLVAAIGLVVLGPERLPHAIKVTAYWVGKMRRSFQSVKAELEREIGADEIKRQIHNEAVMKELNQTRQRLQEEVKDLEQSVDLSPGEQKKSPVNHQNDDVAADTPATHQQMPAQRMADKHRAERDVV